MTEHSYGVETAFTADFGQGRPRIGILGEFDALSGLSQKAGLAEKEALIPGANGHGCGHNLLGAGSVAAALAVKKYLEDGHQGTVVYFAHCIARSGSYLSAQAEVPEGTALAYLIAPPLEAVTALDAALKAADVTMRLFYGPPTETNFAGGLLSGTQPACQAACEAFAREVRRVAAAPRVL